MKTSNGLVLSAVALFVIVVEKRNSKKLKGDTYAKDHPIFVPKPILYLTLKTGKKITQQELFSHLIEFVMSRKDNFFGRLSKLPLSEKKKRK
jgi:hypothetical protein